MASKSNSAWEKRKLYSKQLNNRFALRSETAPIETPMNIPATSGTEKNETMKNKKRLNSEPSFNLNSGANLRQSKRRRSDSFTISLDKTIDEITRPDLNPEDKNGGKINSKLQTKQQKMVRKTPSKPRPVERELKVKRKLSVSENDQNQKKAKVDALVVATGASKTVLDRTKAWIEKRRLRQKNENVAVKKTVPNFRRNTIAAKAPMAELRPKATSATSAYSVSSKPNPFSTRVRNDQVCAVKPYLRAAKNNVPAVDAAASVRHHYAIPSKVDTGLKRTRDSKKLVIPQFKTLACKAPQGNLELNNPQPSGSSALIQKAPGNQASSSVEIIVPSPRVLRSNSFTIEADAADSVIVNNNNNKGGSDSFTIETDDTVIVNNKPNKEGSNSFTIETDDAGSVVDNNNKPNKGGRKRSETFFHPVETPNKRRSVFQPTTPFRATRSNRSTSSSLSRSKMESHKKISQTRFEKDIESSNIEETVETQDKTESSLEAPDQNGVQLTSKSILSARKSPGKRFQMRFEETAASSEDDTFLETLEDLPPITPSANQNAPNRSKSVSFQVPFSSGKKIMSKPIRKTPNVDLTLRRKLDKWTEVKPASATRKSSIGLNTSRLRHLHCFGAHSSDLKQERRSMTPTAPRTPGKPKSSLKKSSLKNILRASSTPVALGASPTLRNASTIAKPQMVDLDLKQTLNDVKISFLQKSRSTEEIFEWLHQFQTNFPEITKFAVFWELRALIAEQKGTVQDVLEIYEQAVGYKLESLSDLRTVIDNFLARTGTGAATCTTSTTVNTSFEEIPSSEADKENESDRAKMIRDHDNSASSPDVYVTPDFPQTLEKRRRHRSLTRVLSTSSATVTPNGKDNTFESTLFKFAMAKNSASMTKMFKDFNFESPLADVTAVQTPVRRSARLVNSSLQLPDNQGPVLIVPNKAI